MAIFSIFHDSQKTVSHILQPLFDYVWAILGLRKVTSNID
ncbi:hypothetical protein HMPREF1549_00108 [Actinomyces johnsonii F0510]|uniref:Uncharacterized protein n=1 Tax=Actinomyces johnsonii F0510 TaxID=1227262 RepID=U1RYW3_9ACTO|nr:hypothetical protein HMPREF1549_00108 [Actinomyces johnsonii F0510]